MARSSVGTSGSSCALYASVGATSRTPCSAATSCQVAIKERPLPPRPCRGPPPVRPAACGSRGARTPRRNRPPPGPRCARCAAPPAIPGSPRRGSPGPAAAGRRPKRPGRRRSGEAYVASLVQRNSLSLWPVAKCRRQRPPQSARRRAVIPDKAIRKRPAASCRSISSGTSDVLRQGDGACPRFAKGLWMVRRSTRSPSCMSSLQSRVQPPSSAAATISAS